MGLNEYFCLKKLKTMIKKILAAGLFLSSLCSKGQITKDTVSIGAGYALQKWYSLQNDEQGSAPKNNWDIAFETSGMGSGIFINSVTGTQLWVYPNGDTTAWNTLDTAGISSWKPYYNSDTSWSIGAFNKGKTNNPNDWGWGIYNTITHQVIGDSIYVIKLSNNSYKKIWIKKLASGTYYFQYSDLNGNNLQNVSISKTPYNSKTLIYYSIQTNSVVDREPPSSQWDLLFTQYTAFVPSPYNVTGVLMNKGVTAVKVYPVDTSYMQWYNHSFNTAINTIGYNWKNYSGGWQIEDSLVYFVKSKQGDIWKVIFTGFGGSANGNYIFIKQKVSAVSVSEFSNSNNTLMLYPNPAEDIIQLISFDTNEFNEIKELSIFSPDGKKWTLESINTGMDPFTLKINTDMLTPGLYFLSVTTKNQKSIIKFIKK